MKKAIVLLALAFLVSGVTICQASPNPSTIQVSAQVPTGSEFNYWMLKGDSKKTFDPSDDTFIAATTMAYGTLEHILGDGSEAGVWYSPFYYAVFFSAITGGAKYKFLSTSSGLYSSGIKLPVDPDHPDPDEAWGITMIDCRKLENIGTPEEKDVTEPCPTGASLGDKGPASVTDKKIYDSGTGAESAQIVRADFSIPPDTGPTTDPFPGWSGVPLSQKSGTYSGTLQIRMQTY
jgi:hypothetical protein